MSLISILKLLVASDKEPFKYFYRIVINERQRDVWYTCRSSLKFLNYIDFGKLQYYVCEIWRRYIVTMATGGQRRVGSCSEIPVLNTCQRLRSVLTSVHIHHHDKQGIPSGVKSDNQTELPLGGLIDVGGVGSRDNGRCSSSSRPGCHLSDPSWPQG